MSLLFNTLFAWKASGTHHKLALEALRHMQRHDAEEWQELFLAEVDRYLKGSKAPDDEFKDFKNHVLHVGDNFWGGAISATENWYGKTVQSLQNRDWPTAVYNMGVTSHYFTDPIMPFHTGQSERETIVHRAAEWSITKSYDEMKAMLTGELGGYPTVELPSGNDWLAKLIRRGATMAHEHYDFIIDHYNFEVGVKNPPLGLDRESKAVIAKLQAFAIVAFARVIDQAIVEAGVLVPSINVSLPALLSTASIPMKFITSRMNDAKERAQVEAMFVEFKKTGKVIETLPEDDRTVRRLHCEEVLKIPLAELDKQPAGPIGSKYSGPRPAAPKPAETPVAKATIEKGSPKPLETSVEKPAAISKQTIAAPASAPPPTVTPAPVLNRSPLKATAKVDDLAPPKLARTPEPEAAETPATATENTAPLVSSDKVKFSLDSPVVDAPSIGNKTSDRMAAIGIRTVRDFLEASPQQISQKLRAAHLTANVLTDWQDQARLILAIPSLKGHDAQLIVGVDIRTGDELAQANARDLHELIAEFCTTSEGKRILRESEPPELAEVGQWIVGAKKARASKAA
jgi:Domain of unknown function (DUF4332)